jgi:Tfp pilus assembly protein PilX
MNSTHRLRWKKRASSLIITLLAITVLATVMIAFVQAMMMARTNAKSYRDILQANQAAEAGLEMAISQMGLAVGTNQAFVTGVTNSPSSDFPVTVIGRENLTNASQLMPLVSGPTNLLVDFGSTNWANFTKYATVRTDTDPKTAIDLNTAQHLIQSTDNANLYRAAWVALTNVVGTTTNYSRFAYIVLDEQARLNPALNTGTGAGMTDETNWYSGPQDISLTNEVSQLLTEDQALAVRANSNAIALSHESIAEVLGSRAGYENIKHLLTSQTNPTFDVIPQWLPDGGKPKYNLNDLATNSIYGATAAARAANIAQTINRNLTNFSSRDAALRGGQRTLYLNRLAANIVDYVDTDSSPTVITRSDSQPEVTGPDEPAGKDFPLPVMFVTRMWRTPAIKYDAPAQTTLNSQVYIQLWNPYTTPIVLSGTLHVDLTSRPKILWGSAPPTPLNDYSQDLAVNLTLRPNEFKVLGFPVAPPQTFISPTDVPSADPTSEKPPNPANNNNPAYWPSFVTTPAQNKVTATNHDPYFKLYYNGVLVDLSRVDAAGHGGLYQKGFVFDTDTSGAARNWFEANNQTMFTTGVAMADPRSSSSSTREWAWSYTAGQWQTNTTWGGRQADNNPIRTENFQTAWANRDYVPVNPSIGVAPPDKYTPPDPSWSAYNPTKDAPAAVSVMRNGPMKSIGELGHIFDPAYGEDDLSSSGFAGGGGRTLRIGQPEFTVTGTNNWNTNGRRSTELLDLFTVSPTTAQGAGAPGRINPNTAPVEILSAALAGIKIDSDETTAARALDVTNVANAIITNRPYSSLSDFYKVLPDLAAGTNYSPAFSAQVGGGTTNLATFDRAREEAFGKLVQHLTVQSRCYRVYAVGQTLDAHQNPRGTAILEATVFLNFDKASQQFKPVVQYRKSLQ